ncbi:hypothetical protein K438DRAFT_1764278 [Mycena galopus ATCC 62051]|nr:hypothetical protein K438DRAFT_1764278 [Mycena galopus ATCC 62051]
MVEKKYSMHDGPGRNQRQVQSEELTYELGLRARSGDKSSGGERSVETKQLYRGNWRGVREKEEQTRCVKYHFAKFTRRTHKEMSSLRASLSPYFQWRGKAKAGWLPSGPTPNDMSIFTSPPAPTTQYYCPSEVYIATMHNRLCQLGSVVMNMQSINDTFVIDTRTGEDGSSICTLLDVILLTTLQQGIYCSDICGRWDDVFRRQGLIAHGGDDPAIRDALYAHSRLVPSPHQNNMSLRVLRMTTDPTLAIPLLESGNFTFSLPLHQAIEATLDYLQLRNSISPETVTKCVPVVISTMEDLCEEWLIGILSITARLVSRKEKEDYVAIHTRYMTTLAKIEEKAAKQVCRLSKLRRSRHLSLYPRVIPRDGHGIPNRDTSFERLNQRFHYRRRNDNYADSLATRNHSRTILIAYFLMEPERQDSHQRYMKAALAPLRNNFFSMSSHSRVPNYHCELSKVFSGRRKELASCSSRGQIPPPFTSSSTGTTLEALAAKLRRFPFHTAIFNVPADVVISYKMGPRFAPVDVDKISLRFAPETIGPQLSVTKEKNSKLSGNGGIPLNKSPGTS